MIKAVFFDLDGTLVEFKLDVGRSKAEVLKLIISMVPNIEGLDGTKSYYHMLDEVSNSVDFQTYEKIRASLYAILDKYEEAAAKRTRLREGALNTLMYLKTSGRKIALLTNSGRSAVDYVLQRFNIGKYFDKVLTRDELKFMKPSPEGIYHLLNFFDLNPEECVIVGDGVIDIIPSRIAGLKSIIVSGGYGTIEKVVQEKPDYLISSLSDLASLIESL
ncbi:MAG: HAD family hydrolase [Nitrososphaeria archaeon]